KSSLSGSPPLARLPITTAMAHQVEFPIVIARVPVAPALGRFSYAVRSQRPFPVLVFFSTFAESVLPGGGFAFVARPKVKPHESLSPGFVVMTVGAVAVVPVPVASAEVTTGVVPSTPTQTSTDAIRLQAVPVPVQV